MAHTCESCSYRYNVFPKTPCKIANNKFFRNFPPVIENQERPSQFPSYYNPTVESQLLLQPDPLLPAGTNRPRRKSTKMVGKKSTSCPPKKVLCKKRPTKAPTPNPSFIPQQSIRTNTTRIATPTQSYQTTAASMKTQQTAQTGCAASYKSEAPRSIPSKTFTQKTQQSMQPSQRTQQSVAQSQRTQQSFPQSMAQSSYVTMQNSDCSTVVRGEVDPHPVDCACVDCEKNGPSQLNAVSFIEEQHQSQSNYCGDAASSCVMSKLSEKNISNYFFDNPSLKTTQSKKASACAELLDALDDDTEIWILQTPKCFDINKIVNTDLNSRKSTSGKSLDVCSEKFKSPVNMICLAPEKAAEYKSVCDQIRLIQPRGKITVIEQEIQPQSDMTCSENNQTDDECSQVSAIDSCVAPLASKKVQKKLNDQRFTIETTVTVENVGDERSKCKKPRKSLKQESAMENSCMPLVPPEASPMKRKTKKC